MTGLIFHIPHSSTGIPDEYSDDFCLSDEELTQEKLLMTDWHTAELFGTSVRSLGQSVEFPVSRLLVDPERFHDDAQESMSKVGMGVLYTKTAHGKALRSPGMIQGERREELLQRYYVPHHAKLEKLTEDALKRDGRAIIIDCHSFPSVPLPYEPCQKLERPDICLGADDFHTPPNMLESIKQSFEACGYSVEVNTPFAGSLTPIKYYQSDPRVSSIMIEVNRCLYMDEKTSRKTIDFNGVSKNIHQALKNLFDLRSTLTKKFI